MRDVNPYLSYLAIQTSTLHALLSVTLFPASTGRQAEPQYILMRPKRAKWVKYATKFSEFATKYF